MNQAIQTPATRSAACATVILLSMLLAATSIDVSAAEETAPDPPKTLAVPAHGSWYLSTNATPSNWSKTGLYYEVPWEDHFDAGDNTTLELYVKALTPRTIEVFNAKLLSIGVHARPDAINTNNSGGVMLGDYVTLTDQNWTKVSIPLADIRGVNFHDLIYFPALPQACGTGEYALGIDEVRFVGGSKPVLWYGDAHPNNPIDIHGAGMAARFVSSGGVDLTRQEKK